MVYSKFNDCCASKGRQLFHENDWQSCTKPNNLAAKESAGKAGTGKAGQEQPGLERLGLASKESLKID